MEYKEKKCFQIDRIVLYKCGNLLTKELSENPGEKVQIARNMVTHGWWKRFYNCVNAKDKLQELQIEGVTCKSNSKEKERRGAERRQQLHRLTYNKQLNTKHALKSQSTT